MQAAAGTPKGTYSERAGDYDDFDARLAVIRFRSEALDTGVPCGKAVGAASSGAAPAFPNAALAQAVGTQAVGTQAGQPGFGNASCITVLAILGQQQMQDFRRLHQIACQPGAPPRQCQSVFNAAPLSAVFSARQDLAPVNLVGVTLGEIVRQEAKLKSARP